jgi:hypothetical protein
MKSEVFYILGNDIIELIHMIEKERVSRRALNVMNTETKSYIYDKETDDNKNYNDYKKLIDTLIQDIYTYRRLFPYNDIDYSNIMQWIKEETNVVHKLMVDSKDRNNYGQYRCLNYVYIKLLDELNSYN